MQPRHYFQTLAPFLPLSTIPLQIIDKNVKTALSEQLLFFSCTLTSTLQLETLYNENFYHCKKQK